MEDDVIRLLNPDYLNVHLPEEIRIKIRETVQQIFDEFLEEFRNYAEWIFNYFKINGIECTKLLICNPNVCYCFAVFAGLAVVQCSVSIYAMYRQSRPEIAGEIRSFLERNVGILNRMHAIVNEWQTPGVKPVEADISFVRLNRRYLSERISEIYNGDKKIAKTALFFSGFEAALAVGSFAWGCNMWGCLSTVQKIASVGATITLSSTSALNLYSAIKFEERIERIQQILREMHTYNQFKDDAAYLRTNEPN